MSRADERLDDIADCDFAGKNIAGQIIDYATLNQRFAKDMARELSTAADAAQAAMRQLQGHPLLGGMDVRWRSRRVARVLREASELCAGVSAECVAFTVQFRQEFADPLRGRERTKKPKDYNEKVDP